MAPWFGSYIPPALRNLAAPLRKRAIEKAAALRAEGHDEAAAFRIALASTRGQVPPLPEEIGRNARAERRR